jgi:pyruvate decarboxylase
MVSARFEPANLVAQISTPPSKHVANVEVALFLVLDRMYTCKQPMILVDGEIRAFGAIGELSQIIKLTDWPTWTTPFGKGLVDKTRRNCHGI